MNFVLKTCLACCVIIGMTPGCHIKSDNKKKSGDLEMDGMEQAMRQEFNRTRDPQLNRIPRERLELAKERLASLEFRNFRMMALSWQERGPNNIGGRTRAILVDRADASGNTVFAGSVSGGIFKTTNFTATTPSWSPVDDNMVNLAVTALVQDRNNASIMYAGTGEGWFNIDGLRGAGVFKSTNGGSTWTQIPSTATFEYIQDMAMDNNGNLYASMRNSATSNRGVVRSIDGGSTWTQVLGAPLPGFATGRAADLEVAPNGDIYATLGIFSRTAVLKSSFSANGINTGALGTWTDITPVHTAITQRAEIAVAPTNSQRLYLLMQDSASSEVKALYRSSDAGNTWDSLPAPAPLNNNSNSQTWYNLIAAVDPNNQDILTVGGYHIGKSIDAGATFTDITSGSSNVHVDQHVLLYVGSSNLISGNDGGIYYTTNATAITPNFLSRNNGFNVTQFYGADFHPTLPDYFLAGAQDNNTQKFTAPGINTTISVVGGDGGIPHIDQTDGLIQIAATTGNNFYRSVNGGASFSALSVNNNRGQFINPSDYDDAANILYSGDDPGKYFYITNLSGTVTSGVVTLPQITSSRDVTAVKVDASSGSGTIWIAASYHPDPNITSVVPVVIKVSNANTASATASVVSDIGNTTTTLGAYISCINIDPADPNHLLVTLSNYGVPSVYQSTNGGVNWTSIEGNLPDMPVYWGIFVPSNAQLNGTTGGNGGILLGTELGVWSTSAVSGAATQWIPNKTGLPNVRTDMLKIRYPDYLMVAATHGRGLYTTTLPSIAFPTGLPTVNNTRDFIKFTTVNRQMLHIATGNTLTTKMQIRIFDANGRLVRSADTKYADQDIPVAQLPVASYILRIYGNKGEQYTWHFVITD